MLTYGGVPLLIPDDGGEIVRWLEAYQAIEDTIAFCEVPPAIRSSRPVHKARFEINKGIGLPVLNYPPSPPPRLNSLYWPTGATRWARGYFLATKVAKDQITAMAHSPGGNTPLALKWGDDVTAGEPEPLEADMYLLPPMPVSAVDPAKFSGQDTLWLLPLVDVRYWWQYLNVEDLEISSSTAWADLFTTLATALDTSIIHASDFDTFYGRPDRDEFTRRYFNAALLLDAAAASIGRRIVRLIDGTVFLESVEEAETALESNLEQDWRLIAGGDNSDEAGELPEKVVVVFRESWQKTHEQKSNGQVYAVEVDVDADGAKATGKKWLVKSTQFAEYDNTDTLGNSSFLNSLAERIRDDYCGWLAKQYDRTFAGAQPWELCGFDDAVTWDFGRPIGQDGRLSATTRVSTLPANFGAEVQATQAADRYIVDVPAYCYGLVDGSSLAACDLQSPDIRLDTITAMTRGNGSIYITSQSGSDVNFAQLTAGSSFNFYNPLPFEFTSGDMVWLKKCGEHLVIDRPAHWQPYAAFKNPSGGVDLGTSASGYCSLELAGAKGAIATAPGNVVTIDCPVTDRAFLVSWEIDGAFDFSAAVTSFKWRANLETTGTLLTVSTQDFSQRSGTAGGDALSFSATAPGGTGGQLHSLSGQAILILSKTETIKLKSEITIPSGTIASHVVYGRMTVVPLFNG